jgi:type IV pilus assembly protein PilA
MLLLGPFGVGLLAGIAVPAYQDFALRGQVASALARAAPVKAAIAEAAAAGKAWQDITTESLDLQTLVSDNGASRLDVATGVSASSSGGIRPPFVARDCC